MKDVNNYFDLRLGNCLEVLKDLQDNSIDSIVTDPPYGLSFMGKKWDYDVPSKEIWQECLRVLKPGGHLLSFAGSRTYHRMAVRIEDAGFEIRDQIMWIYGSGFPKSHNIGKNIEKIKVGGKKNLKQIGTRLGIKVETGTSGFSYSKEYVAGKSMGGRQISGEIPVYEITNDYEGWGTALKPAHEPIVMARKPFQGNVAQNVLEWGTGGINVDGCRISVDMDREGSNAKRINKTYSNSSAIFGQAVGDTTFDGYDKGRFPANVILDEEAGKLLDEQSGERKGFSGGGGPIRFGGAIGGETLTNYNYHNDNGGASRFFYCPKASKKDRNEGLESFEKKLQSNANFRPNHLEAAKNGNSGKPHGRYTPTQNHHPTIKPTDLMLYLIRLVTPKEGTTLDPFMGSGSTGKAAIRGGFKFFGIERESEYFDIAQARLDYEVEKLKSAQTKLEL